MNSSKPSDYIPMPSGHPSDEVDIDVRKFLLMFWRRKLVILMTMLVFVGGLYLILNKIQPSYNAQASVLIESNISASGELKSFISSVRIDNSVILSEAEVLKSRMMARQVILDLNLMNDPEFNPNLNVANQNILSNIFGEGSSSTQKSNFKALSLHESKSGMNKEEIEQSMGVVVDTFLKNIRVRPIPGSFVLQVEFSSVDPNKAALIANKIVDTYLAQNMNMKLQTSQRITSWLDSRLKTLREQVRNTEDAIEDFRQQYNVDYQDINDFSQQQISGFANQMVLAKAKEAQAKARLDQIQNWMKDPSTIEMTDEAVNSRILQNLKLKEAEHLKNIAELSVRYGPKHPTMMDAELALAETRDQMRQELRTVAKNIEANLKLAQKQVVEIENAVNSTGDMGLRNQSQRAGMDDEENILSDNEITIRLRELMREKESSEAILETFLQTYKRAADQGKLQESQARVISYATSPIKPYYPNKPLFLSLAIVVSFFIGLALALLLEKIVNAYQTVEELEADTGKSCLGLIPLAQNMDTNKPVADYILNKEGTRIAESVRTLRMVLNLRAKNNNQKSQVVSITSALPDEGKTTLSSWMARVAAKSGERVIIIDCDLRRPRLHDAFGKAPQNTLVEYLTGKCTLEEALYRDPGTNMHAIFGRAVPNNALDLLSKDRMSNLIEALKEQYDLIILDCPACLSVSDSRLLSSKSDQTIFAVAWNETPREVVNAGVKQFADFGYDALTLVLTHVDLKKYSKYGFNDAIHYYSAYNPYYQD